MYLPEPKITGGHAWPFPGPRIKMVDQKSNIKQDTFKYTYVRVANQIHKDMKKMVKQHRNPNMLYFLLCLYMYTYIRTICTYSEGEAESVTSTV